MSCSSTSTSVGDFLANFFKLDGPGVTQVALGHASLEEALAPIAITDAAGRAARPHTAGQVAANGNGNGNDGGTSVRGSMRCCQPASPTRPREVQSGLTDA